MTARFSYRLVPGTLDTDLDRARRRTPEQLVALVTEIVHTGRTNIVKHTPVGWSGVLRGGYATEVTRVSPRRVRGVIVNPIIYHDPVEEGRQPGRMPPIEALIPWVGSKLGVPPGPERRAVAFLVARKIGRRGTPAQRMVEEGWEETRRQIRPKLKEMGLRIVRDIR